jgi:hypothetical protein
MPCTGITIELDELENTTAPVERERVAADAIIEARRSALKSKLRASSFSSRELRWPMVTQRHYPVTVTNLIALHSDRAGLQLFLLLDSCSNWEPGSRFEGLRHFIRRAAASERLPKPRLRHCNAARQVSNTGNVWTHFRRRPRASTACIDSVDWNTACIEIKAKVGVTRPKKRHLNPSMGCTRLMRQTHSARRQ